MHHQDISENRNEPIREVTSLDIEYAGIENDMYGDFGTKNVMPVKFQSGLDQHKNVGIPIVKLNRGEQVNVRFSVQKGIGKMHAKWSPV